MTPRGAPGHGSARCRSDWRPAAVTDIGKEEKEDGCTLMGLPEPVRFPKGRDDNNPHKIAAFMFGWATK